MSWVNSSIVSMIRIMPRWFIHPFARTYVAGESIEETVPVVKRLMTAASPAHWIYSGNTFNLLLLRKILPGNIVTFMM